MQIRFTCPACGGSHITDMPETTIHLTCGVTCQPIELRLTAGGDVRTKLFEDDTAAKPQKPRHLI